MNNLSYFFLAHRLLYYLLFTDLIQSLTATVVTDYWTHSPTGCECSFNKTRRDCACCQNEGCQCTATHPNQCVPCGNGNLCGMRMELDVWTERRDGCSCYFDRSKTHCACCKNGGCPCGSDHPHQCVPCGYGCLCGQAPIKLADSIFNNTTMRTGMELDVWTERRDGCSCYFDRSKTHCACCKNGGCPCGSDHPHQCVPCGYGCLCGQAPIKLADSIFNNTTMLADMEFDVWTERRDGCSCYFDRSNTHCACCKNGGCPCGRDHPHQCVPCGYGCLCGQALLKLADSIFNNTMRAAAENRENYSSCVAPHYSCSSGAFFLPILTVEGIIIAALAIAIILILRHYKRKPPVVAQSLKGRPGSAAISKDASQRSDGSGSERGNKYQSLEGSQCTEPVQYEELRQINNGRLGAESGSNVGMRPHVEECNSPFLASENGSMATVDYYELLKQV